MAQNSANLPNQSNQPNPEGEEGDLRYVALASTHFFAGRYDACLQALQSLGSQGDHRAKHNELVAKYFKVGATPQATEGLLGALTKLLDEHQLASANYNCAVLNFQLQHYPKTLDILFKIFTHLEPFEEYLTMRSAFLLIETCIRMRALDKNTVSKVLTLLDRAIPQLKTTLAESEKQPQQPQETDGGLLPPMPSPNEFKVLLQNIKARLQLIFLSPGAKAEISLLSELCLDGDVTIPFLKSNLEFLEANYPAAIKHLNEIKKINTLSLENKIIYFNSLGCIHLKMEKYAAASFYFTKALDANNKLLGPWGNGDSEVPPEPENSNGQENKQHIHKRHPFCVDKSSSILYNYGLSLLFRGKASLAFSCFQNALQLSYHRPHIWLRLGESCVVHHLKKKRKILRKRKQQGNEKQQEVPAYLLIKEIFEGNKSGRILLLESDHDQLSKDSHSIPTSAPRQSVKGESGSEWTTPQICLSYGYACFLNSIELLDSTLTLNEKADQKVIEDESDEHDLHHFEDAQEEPNNNLPDGSKTKGPSQEHWQKVRANQLLLKLCGHVNIAWIALQNKDPVIVIAHTRTALDICKQLATEGQTSKHISTYEYLATIYNAEANIATNKLTEALDVLSNYLKHSEGKAIDLGPGLDLDPDLGWEISTVKSESLQASLTGNAKAALFANLATIQLIKGDIGAAKKCCDAAKALNKNFTPILLIEIYLALVTNKVDVALDILANQRFSPIELLAFRGRPNKT